MSRFVSNNTDRNQISFIPSSLEEVKTMLNGQSIGILQSLDIEQRNKIIRQIKGIEGVTQRQIARVTGIHQSIIFKL